MASLRFFHETSQPALTSLEPSVPPIDRKTRDDNGLHVQPRSSSSESEDTRPAVWLRLGKEGAPPHKVPGDPYRYVVEIDDADVNLIKYDFVPGWYRYLVSVSPVDFFTLDPDNNSYLSRADLIVEYTIAKERLDNAHAEFHAAVEAALNEPGAAKAALHGVAVLKKRQLSTAATAEAEVYECLMAWELSAPKHLVVSKTA